MAYKDDTDFESTATSFLYEKNVHDFLVGIKPLWEKYVTKKRLLKISLIWMYCSKRMWIRSKIRPSRCVAVGLALETGQRVGAGVGQGGPDPGQAGQLRAQQFDLTLRRLVQAVLKNSGVIHGK